MNIEEKNTKVFVGKIAPDFKSKAILGDNEIDPEFTLSKYLKNHYGVVFFYPLNFTFVCPTEIIGFNNRMGEFASRNAKVVAISVDSHFSSLAWKNTPVSKGGIGNVQFPLVSDLKKEISSMYNVLTDEGISLRGTFVIDTEFKVRQIMVNDSPIGRNIDEAIRIIDAIEYTKEYGAVCPAGWQKGEEGFTANSEGISEYLTSNAENI